MFLYHWFFPSVNARELLSRIESGYSFRDLLNYTVNEWDSDDQVFDIIFKLADNNSHSLLKSISQALKNYLSKTNSNREKYLIDELKSENEILKENMSDIIDQKLQNITKMFESLNFTIKENFSMTNSMIAEDKTPQIIVQGHDSDTVKKLINKAVSEKESTIFELQNEIHELKSLLENSSSKVATCEEIIEKQRKEIEELNNKLRELEKRLSVTQTSATSSKKTNNPNNNKETKTEKKKLDFSEYRPNPEDSSKENPQSILTIQSPKISNDSEQPSSLIYVDNIDQIFNIVKQNPSRIKLYKNYRTYTGNTLLIYAMQHSTSLTDAFLQEFINAGYNINEKGNKGRTALWYACHNGNYNVVKFLMKLKNIHNLNDDENISPYTIAMKNHKFNVLPLLEQKGFY